MMRIVYYKWILLSFEITWKEIKKQMRKFSRNFRNVIKLIVSFKLNEEYK